jgi:thiol-disulfide isomerase/thioredoxin
MSPTLRTLIVALGLGIAMSAMPLHAAEPAKAASAGPKKGDVPPALLGKDRKGDLVDLSQYRGKVVVVSFWASWCGPCLKELPALDLLQAHAGDKLLKVIAVNVEDSNDDYRLMMRQMKDFSITMTRDRDGKIAAGYDIRAYPNLWIIGLDGKVAANHRGYGEDSLDRIIDDINRVLREQAALAPAAAG